MSANEDNRSSSRSSCYLSCPASSCNFSRDVSPEYCTGQPRDLLADSGRLATEADVNDLVPDSARLSDSEEAAENTLTAAASGVGFGNAVTPPDCRGFPPPEAVRNSLGGGHGAGQVSQTFHGFYFRRASLHPNAFRVTNGHESIQLVRFINIRLASIPIQFQNTGEHGPHIPHPRHSQMIEYRNDVGRRILDECTYFIL